MSQPAAPTVTQLQEWTPRLDGVPRRTGCYTCSTLLLCHNMENNTFTHLSCATLFSPGDPFSVVLPLNVSDEFMVLYDLVPEVEAPSWHGVGCRLIRLRIGLPVVGSPLPRAFHLTALLPLEPVEDVPPLLRLGAEFLTATRATVRLFTDPARGELIIPR